MNDASCQQSFEKLNQALAKKDTRSMVANSVLERQN